MFQLVLILFSSSHCYSLVATGSRPTGLYQATSYGGKSGLIVTAGPSRMQGAPLALGEGEEDNYDEGQVPYKQQIGEVNPRRGGLFAVIEDVFFKSKHGSENLALEESGQQKTYLDSDHIRHEPAYLYSTQETVNTMDNQTAENLKLSVDDVPRPDQNTLVSLASSSGPVTGPEYPHRPSIAPATLLPVGKDQRNIQPRRYDQYRGNDYHSERREASKSRNKSYFQLQGKQYDPFAFQTTPRSATRDHYIKEKNIFSNRLDSRFSIQVGIIKQR